MKTICRFIFFSLLIWFLMQVLTSSKTYAFVSAVLPHHGEVVKPLVY